MILTFHASLAAGCLVHEGCFLRSQLHVNAAQIVDDLHELAKAHFHVVVNHNTEVLIQRLVQQVHTAQHIGRIDLLLVVAGDLDIQVSHEGSKGDGVLLGVDGHQNHGIRSFPDTLQRVLAHQQNVGNILSLDDKLRKVNIQLNFLLGQHRTGKFFRRFFRFIFGFGLQRIFGCHLLLQGFCLFHRHGCGLALFHVIHVAQNGVCQDGACHHHAQHNCQQHTNDAQENAHTLPGFILFSHF